jgi:hypothetical protein
LSLELVRASLGRLLVHDLPVNERIELVHVVQLRETDTGAKWICQDAGSASAIKTQASS